MNTDLVLFVIEDFLKEFKLRYQYILSDDVLTIRVGEPWLRSIYVHKRKNTRVIFESEGNSGLRKLIDIIMNGMNFRLEAEEFLEDPLEQ
jgi:hypothetical protein